VNTIFSTIATITLITSFGTSALAQDTKLTLMALDGRNGKPLPTQRLLVFIGASPKDVQQHKQSLDVTTDKDGVAILPITRTDTQWLQVFVDFRTLCQTEPNTKSFSVDEIVSGGLTTPNNCGSFRVNATANHLVVFARPATIKEKMDW
jgi:hypothetical protein